MNYNAVLHVSHLLLSLFRVLRSGSLTGITVVDNGSTDGSAAILDELASRSLISLIRHRGRPRHGPGLNRGLNHLAVTARETGRSPHLVWILDSDVIVLRSDALDAAIATIDAENADLIGQIQYDRGGSGGYAHVSSNLLRPERVWRRGVSPFLDDGAPGVALNTSLRAKQGRIFDFPFFREGYLLHVGAGTLQRIIERDERDHPMFEWAEFQQPHFHGNPDGPETLAQFARSFDKAVPELTPAAFADACMDPSRLPDPG